MTIRNVGIVFSPTLGIPAGVFSLMLADFPRVFGVEEESSANANGDDAEAEPTSDGADLVAAGAGGMEGEATPRHQDNSLAINNIHVHPSKRNSMGYAEASADRLLGLTGRSLTSAYLLSVCHPPIHADIFIFPSS